VLSTKAATAVRKNQFHADRRGALLAQSLESSSELSIKRESLLKNERKVMRYI